MGACGHGSEDSRFTRQAQADVLAVLLAGSCTSLLLTRLHAFAALPAVRGWRMGSDHLCEVLQAIGRQRRR